MTVDVSGELGGRAGHDLNEVLIVRYRRPSDGVLPVGVPRCQPLTVQQYVVPELVLDNDDHRVVENNSALKGTERLSKSITSLQN